MDAWIDPVTRDYGLADGLAGELRRDPAGGLANAVYLRLITPLGGWFAAPEVGSRLHELVREKDLVRVERLAHQYAADALQPLLDDGRLSQLDIEVERGADDSGGGRLALRITGTDGANSNAVFNVFVKVA